MHERNDGINLTFVKNCFATNKKIFSAYLTETGTDGDAEMKIFNVSNNLFNFKSNEKNTTHRRMQMIKVLPVAVALSFAQPNPKISKNQNDSIDLKNIKTSSDFSLKRDGTIVVTTHQHAILNFNEKFKNLLEKYEKTRTKSKNSAIGTYGRVNTKLNISKTRYEGRADIFNKYFKGGVLEGKGEKLIELQDKYGINALFLAAITLVESGGGKSKAAKTKNNVAGIRTRQNGKYVLKKFKTVDECLEYLAKNISQNYINKNLETIENINKKYAQSNIWSDSIVYHINRILNTKS